MGYHIILKNSAGCELDGRFATTKEDIKGAVLALVKDCVIEPGDVIQVIATR
jgi:hypothetical protein